MLFRTLTRADNGTPAACVAGSKTHSGNAGGSSETGVCIFYSTSKEAHDPISQPGVAARREGKTESLHSRANCCFSW